VIGIYSIRKAQRCPECSTVCDEGLGRCVACGCRLAGGKVRRWEDAILPYAGIAIVIALIAAAAWYLLNFRNR
jgi:hypothetical protein